MSANVPIGIITLTPDENDPSRGKIDFLAVQDPNQPDPKKAKITARRNQKVSWLIYNYFPDEIDVKIYNFIPTSPFKKPEYSDDVDGYSSPNPGYDDITAKIRKDATATTYKYTITTDHPGIPPLDPELEVDDNGSVTPKPG